MSEPLLEQAEIATRWGVSLRTVIRRVRKYKARPSTYRAGYVPQFDIETVRAMEGKIQKDAAKSNASRSRKMKRRDKSPRPARVLTLAELRGGQ